VARTKKCRCCDRPIEKCLKVASSANRIEELLKQCKEKEETN